MIQGVRIGSTISTLFVNASNSYVEKLHELADGIRNDEPGTAELLTMFAEAHAGRALDLLLQWPESSLTKQEEQADGVQRSA